MSINTHRLLKEIGLSDLRIIRMLPGIKSYSFETNQVIWSKDDDRQPFTHIIKGLVCASTPRDDKEVHPVNIFGDSTWIGEAEFITRQPSGLDYICLSPTRLISIPFDEALDAFENEAEFSRYIARLVNWRGRQHAEMLAVMRIGSPALRVVMGLSMLTDAMLNNSSHQPKHILEDHLEIAIKQSVLAAMCGVSRGIFSLCVQQLTEAGWLRVSYASIEIQLVRTWQLFLTEWRQDLLSITKPTMHDLLALMQVANAHTKKLLLQTP